MVSEKYNRKSLLEILKNTCWLHRFDQELSLLWDKKSSIPKEFLRKLNVFFKIIFLNVKSLYENTGNIVQPMDALIMALDLVDGENL